MTGWKSGKLKGTNNTKNANEKTEGYGEERWKKRARRIKTEKARNKYREGKAIRLDRE
eukprot:GDKH01027024.1.p2 GENE.GDKH01027024.1~~GDKH01027024.1.p2  ORF type:complete len:58 (-),score=0.59 GDKH01027024.1:65-238(-)